MSPVSGRQPSLIDRILQPFAQFAHTASSGGIVLLVCTAIALVWANSPWAASYHHIWELEIALDAGPVTIRSTLHHLINDGLMAVFFLLIGLELERELYNGELSDLRNAMLPIFAAVGGVAVPALIHFSLNAGTPTQAGIGIPMATDIAFALGVLALVGSRVPASLKVFLTALAVIDDLIAIVVIAEIYTSGLSALYLAGSIAVWLVFVGLNRFGRVMSLVPYLVGGALMWYLMLRSGVHATIAGVLLAFAIPFSPKEDDAESPSHRLEHIRHKPVAFAILPLFALANTGIIVGTDALASLSSSNSLGIIGGLLLGKPFGITLLSFVAVAAGLSRLPLDLNWKHIFGAGLLGGIGFTMSIFITNLAFTGEAEVINSSKMSILLASLAAGIVGFAFLKLFGAPTAIDDDADTMDLQSE